MKTKNLITTLLATASALPLSALAHVGADGGGHHNFLDSLGHAFAHPFGGADHLAAGIDDQQRVDLVVLHHPRRFDGQLLGADRLRVRRHHADQANQPAQAV